MYSYCLYSVSFSNDYHFGFNGMEKDDEVFNVTGSSYTAEFWQYDSRIGRRWNVDPVNKLWKSSYATFANNPIYFVDPLGLDRGKPKPKRSKRRYSKYKWEFWKKRRIISNPDKGGGGRANSYFFS